MKKIDYNANKEEKDCLPVKKKNSSKCCSYFGTTKIQLFTVNDCFRFDVENIVGFNRVNYHDFVDAGISCDCVDAAITKTEKSKNDTTCATAFFCCL